MIGGVILIIILIIISLISNHFTRAVVALEQGAFQLSTDENYHKINLPGSDEFSRLATIFNRMANDIKSKEKQLKLSVEDARRTNISLLASRNLYQDLIENSPNVITKVDIQGRLKFFNHAASKMFVEYSAVFIPVIFNYLFFKNELLIGISHHYTSLLIII